MLVVGCKGTTNCTQNQIKCCIFHTDMLKNTQSCSNKTPFPRLSVLFPFFFHPSSIHLSLFFPSLFPHFFPRLFTLFPHFFPHIFYPTPIRSLLFPFFWGRYSHFTPRRLIPPAIIVCPTQSKKIGRIGQNRTYTPP